VKIRRKIRSENLYNADEKGFSIGHAKKMKIILKKKDEYSDTKSRKLRVG
jgi:hypothetical protein